MKLKLTKVITMITKYSIYGLVFQSLFLNMLLANPGRAQKNVSVREVKVALNSDDLTVKKIFSQIEEKSDFRFAIDKSDLKSELNQIVNIEAGEKAVSDILLQVSKDSKTKFRQINNNITVSRLELNDTEEIIIDQERSISGTVSDAQNEGIPGVTVQISGTTTGTVTDMNGAYKMSIPEQGATLIFSSLGFTTQEVSIGSRSILDVVLQEDVEQLDEIVVTALGIQRSSKALAYSVAQIDGEELVKVRSTNALQSLRGKVAGLNINGNAMGVKASTRVVIRGNSSMTGNNNPLYVIDGITMSNDNVGGAGMWGGYDAGDGLQAINPDDIETINVLKGGAAAALYGSRASNGVIVITTKSGKGQKGLGIEINSSVQFDNLTNVFDPQKSYGQGQNYGDPLDPLNTFQSWGPLMDGSSRTTWDGSSRPYESSGDNLEKFYRTGVNTANTISLSTGNDLGSTRLSYTRMNAQDMQPRSNLKRNLLSLNTNQKPSDKLTIQSSVKFIDELSEGNPNLSDAPNNANASIRYYAADIDIDDFIGPNGDGTQANNIDEFRHSTNIYFTNPNFVVGRSRNYIDKQRLIGSISAKYDITDFLYVKGQGGVDRMNMHLNDQAFSLWPIGVAFSPGGIMSEQDVSIRQSDLDLFLGTDNLRLSNNLVLNAFIGSGRFSYSREQSTLRGDNIVIPGVYDVRNTSSQLIDYYFAEKAINSVYGSAELAFKDAIFVSLTARNDWFSTLSLAGKESPNNDLYTSASVSAVLSDLVTMPSIINFAKLRGGYSQIAGGADNPYGLSLNYGLTGSHTGNDGVSLPTGQISGGTIPNREIKPFQKNESEIGFDLRMFQSKMTVDFSYYDNSTIGDIVAVSASATSGYTSSLANLGEISNKGIELLIRGTVYEKGDFSADLTLNYAKNNSEIISTNDAGDNIFIDQTRNMAAGVTQVVGEQFGTIYGSYFQRDANGNKIYSLNGDGVPLAVRSTDQKILGNGVAPTQLGIGTDLRYKAFQLSVFFEAKFGAQIYSNTNAFLKQVGMSKETIPEGGREAGFLPDGVMDDGSEMVRVTKENLDVFWANQWDIGEESVYDADFIRFSQLSLSYSIPRSITNKLNLGSASVSVVGKNLALWSDVPNVDPESAYQARNGQGLEYAGLPVPRTVGFNVSLKF